MGNMIINNSTDLLNIINGKVSSTLITPLNNYGRNKEGRGPIEINTLYFNNLPYNVTVVDRHGFRHVVPKVITNLNNSFIIRVLYTISESIFKDCKHLFANLRGTLSNTLEIISNGILSNNTSLSYSRVIIGIDYTLTAEELNSAGGNIYIPDADKVVSCLSLEQSPAHPAAEGSVSESHFLDTIGKDRVGFSMGVGIEMVNRSFGQKSMYTNFMKEIKTIPISKDTTRKEGFYITSLDKNLHATNEQILITSFYSLNEAENIGIYKSVEEAKSGGDIKLLKEEEIIKIKHETELLRLELNTLKLQQDSNFDLISKKHKEELDRLLKEEKIKEQEHESKIRKIKEDNLEATRNYESWVRGYNTSALERENLHKEKIANLEKEREEIKDLYTKKDFKRKNFSETLKIISATITTMGVLMIAYNKINIKVK